MKFRVFGFGVFVHPLALAGIFLLCRFNPPDVLAVMFLSVAAHEAGHFLVARLQHRKIDAFCVEAGGAKLSAETLSSSFFADVCLHLAGVCANFLLSVLSFLLIRQCPREIYFFALYFNVCLAFFHLLPVCTLDGGRALFSFLCMLCSLQRAERISFFVSTFFVCMTGVLCLYLFWKSGFHLSLAALLLFCIASFSKQKKVLAL